jgi:hypothetical protein
MDTAVKPPLLDVLGDASLGAVIRALTPHSDLRLVITYAGREVRAGFHITEVKAGSFVTLDCGGNPDAWSETILQVEDLPASSEQPTHMPVRKFLAILDKVSQRVSLDGTARLTFEIGKPDEPMQVFDVTALVIEPDRIVLQLGPRPAVCKPRHRSSRDVPAVRSHDKPRCCG